MESTSTNKHDYPAYQTFMQEMDYTNDADELPCASKIAFANQQQAEAAAAADAYYHGSRLHTYRCRYCDAWHLSSQPAS